MSKTLVEVFAQERKDQLAEIVADLPPADLRTLRAIINGKLSRRTITPEQQAKMIAAREAKKSSLSVK
jgi:hypothetical protein